MTKEELAEEHAKAVYRLEPYGAESDSAKDFLAGYTAAEEQLKAEVERMREALEGLIEELQVFLNVSQKIHFPEAREKVDAARKLLEALSECERDGK